MKSKFVRLAALTGGVAAAGVLFAVPALAHGAPFTISAGSAAAGTSVSVTGTATATITFKDTTTNVSITCTSSVVAGSATVGSSSGAPIALINGGTAAFGTTSAPCTGPVGLKFSVSGYGTWNLNASDSTSGVTTGTITDIRAHLTAVAGPTCAFDVGAATSTSGFTSAGTSSVDAGSVAGTYTNSTQNLATSTTGSNLGLWNVNPAATAHQCVSGSILKQGDSATFSGTYQLKADNAAFNPVAVN